MSQKRCCWREWKKIKALNYHRKTLHKDYHRDLDDAGGSCIIMHFWQSLKKLYFHGFQNLHCEISLSFFFTKLALNFKAIYTCKDKHRALNRSDIKATQQHLTSILTISVFRENVNFWHRTEQSFLEEVSCHGRLHCH